MTKRNITIAGIALILIAIAIIGVDWSRVEARSAGVNEQATRNVSDKAVEATELTREVAGDARATSDATEGLQTVVAPDVRRTVTVAGRVTTQRKQVYGWAVVSRAVPVRVERMLVDLV